MLYCSVYNSKEGASGIISNIDITTVAAFANLFSGIGVANRVIIRTDASITVKLNRSDADSITVAANEKFELDWLAVKAIYVTAAGSANLKIIVGR